MQQLRGLKPAMILDALRAAEAPLFHVTACIPEFFRQPVKAVPFRTHDVRSLLFR